MIKSIVDMLVEKERLEQRYGWKSCLDVPEQYDRMDELAEKAREMTKEFASEHGIYFEDLYEVLSTIAYEIANGNIHEDADYDFYTQDDYIDTYITDGMRPDERNIFDSLFYYMNSNDRAGWLHSNYINPDPNAWSNRMADFVIIIKE